MKAILAVALIAASRAFGSSFPLERLVEKAAQHIAPAEIQQAMARIESTRLRESAEVHQFSDRTLASYFSAVPIDLGDRRAVAYLVFPSRYSTAFFGAHAISYWLLERRSDGSFRVLLSGADDRIEILPQRSHGRFDINSFYGDSVSRLRFDGNVYQHKRG
jgi:hypothetical protein